LRQSTHAPAHVAPDSTLAVGLAHHVMEEHVGGARHRRGGHCANDGIGGQSCLELFRFEPAVEDRPGRAGKYLDRLAHPRPEFAERTTQLKKTPQVSKAWSPDIWRDHLERGFDDS